MFSISLTIDIVADLVTKQDVSTMLILKKSDGARNIGKEGHCGENISKHFQVQYTVKESLHKILFTCFFFWVCGNTGLQEYV